MNTPEARQPRHLAFLLGSGVSLSDGFPRTDEITEAVERHLRAERLDDEAALFESLRWHLTREEGLQEGQRTNPEARRANYEDIYYLASQLSDLASGEYDNPAVYPLMDRLLVDSRMGPIAFRDTLPAPTSERPLLAASRLGDISASLTRAIKSTVATELTAPFRRGTVTYSGYGAVLNALRDPAVDAIEVFTLNHDCLLEATLDHHGVDYTVVVPGDGNHSYGRGGAEPSPNARLRIVKVHGSVSWGIKHEPGEQLWDRLRRLGFEVVGTAAKGEPVILVGRFNKMTDQANQVLFLDLLYAFREGLAGVRHLVVSGYGFSDKNVNTLLREWLSWEDERKAVVVHKNRKELLGSARAAIAGRPDLDSSRIEGIEAAERRGKLGFYPHWFQATSWAELKDVLEFG